MSEVAGRSVAPSRSVTEAMRCVDRRDFLPTHQRHRAGFDGPLSIGHGMTNSQPRTVSAMLDWLAVEPGQHILDVGSGSGWTTALLAHLTGPTGSVLGVEIVPDLVTWGAANLAAAGMPWARIETARPGRLGAPERAPFDRILVSAMATGIPAELVAQLSPTGILVVPVADRMCRVARTPGQPDRVEWSGHYRFVPLLDTAP